MMRLIFCSLAVLLLGACRTKYVEVPVVVPEVREHYCTDTVMMRDVDSVVVRERGDTVFLERWKTSYRDRWRERIVRDSVPYPVPKPYRVEIERKFSFFEMLRLKSWWWIVFVAIGEGLLLWLIKRRR